MQEPGSGHWVVKSGQLKNIGTLEQQVNLVMVHLLMLKYWLYQIVKVWWCNVMVKEMIYHQCFSAPDEGKTCIT